MTFKQLLRGLVLVVLCFAAIVILFGGQAN